MKIIREPYGITETAGITSDQWTGQGAWTKPAPDENKIFITVNDGSGRVNNYFIQLDA